MNEETKLKTNYKSPFSPENLEDMARHAASAVANLAATVYSGLRVAEKYTEYVRDLTESYSKNINAFYSSIIEMSQNTLQTQQALAEHGWFGSEELLLNDSKELLDLINKKNFKELDEILIEETSEDLDKIEEELCLNFPLRKNLIREGLENHREGRFASAITLLLTQSDGICLDLFGQVYFKTDKRIPVVAPLVDSLSLDLLGQLLTGSIKLKAGINADDTMIPAGQSLPTPNRHQILHGKITDYPSEINSLKIISFVGWMGRDVCNAVTRAKASQAKSIGTALVNSKSDQN